MPEAVKVDERFARFRGMKLSHGGKPVEGPFLVRIYLDRTRRPVYARAELLPTKQPFRGQGFESCRELGVMESVVGALFLERLGEWTEVRP